MELKEESILVVGAGIAGLSIGYWLKKQGKKVTIAESENRIGGKIDTIHKNGFELDIGPVTCALTPALNELLQELNLTDQIIEPTATSSKRYIYSKGKIHRIEPSLPKLLTSSILSLNGRLSLMNDFWCKAANEPTEEESIAGFVRRHFGEEAHQKLFNPVLGGIYAGDTERLSIQSCLPMLKELAGKYGSVIKGLKKNQKNNSLSRKIISMNGGFGKIIEGFQKRIGTDIKLSTEIVSVVSNDGRYLVTSKINNQQITEHYDRVYFTLPAFSFSKIIQGTDIHLANMLREIPYSKVWQVHCAVDKGDVDFEGFGLLVPAQEKKMLLGAIHVSGLFPGKAPHGKALFTLFCGGTRPYYFDLDIQQAIKEFKIILNLAETPNILYVQGWDNAIPQFNVGHADIKKKIKAFEVAHPHLHIAGNYVSGVSVGDCMKCAFDITHL